jgi:hypothetical protein
MIRLLLIFTLLANAVFSHAQKKQDQESIPAYQQDIDSIAFHLYTDSLKKGVYNYINVDGHLPGGRWLPLTAKELEFTSDAGRFEGNNIVIDTAFKGQKITITATYKRNRQLTRSVIIYLKIKPDDEHLKTKEEILQEMEGSGGKNRKKKKDQ